MSVHEVKNIVIAGSKEKPIALDLLYPNITNSDTKLPVIVYVHGFNGFKDWGNFGLIAHQFANKGFFFVKFNFSHNGTSPQHPEEFIDLDSFANNNYSKELYDLNRVIDWLHLSDNAFFPLLDLHKIALIGHSKGGAVSIVKTAEDRRIGALVTWAAPAHCKTPWDNWSEDRMLEWKQSGTQYYLNGRTKQQMPMNHQLYEDYLANRERLDVLKAAANITVPWLICHGYDDTQVSLINAKQLCKAQPEAEVYTLPGDHVFGRRHPWTVPNLPHSMQLVVDKSASFLKNIFSPLNDQ